MIRCGDVILVEYPFTDRSGSKLRPVLVVSNDTFNKGDDVVVVPISSVAPHSDDYALKIGNDDKHFASTGLHRTSWIKWTKPITIDKSVAVRSLGTLAKPVLSEVATKLCSLFTT